MINDVNSILSGNGDSLYRNVKTPAYIFDYDRFCADLDSVKNGLKHAGAICFAMKANAFLTKAADSHVDRFEVCSPGEYEICMERGIDPAKIIVSGVNKTYESMDRIMTLSEGKGIFTIESMRHYEILSSIIAEKNLDIEVFIRLSSGNQFGVDKEEFDVILTKALADEHMNFIGVHYFSGTQKKMKKIQKELLVLDEFAVGIKERFGIESMELEYGPGLSIAYFDSDKIAPPEEQITELEELLAGVKEYSSIGIEMGRFFASDCGFFVTEVVDVKKTGNDVFALIDGGIHQLNYYGQMLGMKKPLILQPYNESEETETYTICGSLCSVNDVLVRGIELKKLNIGDRLVFCSCGAYSAMEGIALFLSREFPSVYSYEKSVGIKMLRDLKPTYVLNTEN